MNQVPQGYNNFQDFLDQHQYSKEWILMFEKIYGKHFISTGGKETTEEFVKLLDLKPGQHVLDVGCGIGGSAFYMAQKYGVKVTGIDLSTNVIGFAKQRSAEMKTENVVLEVADATTIDYPDQTYDVIYSRDVILHIENKLELFRKFWKWLAPGGQLLISDYCCKDGDWSEEFTKYTSHYSYQLLTPDYYAKTLENAGFRNVKAEDKNGLFVDTLRRELLKLDKIQQEFSKNDYRYIVETWNGKINRCRSGEQKWVLFRAEKPCL